MQEASSHGNQAQLSAPVLRRQSSLGQEEAPAWTGRRLAMAALVTLAGGSIAGLLGIGGGMVMGEPLDMLLLVHGRLSRTPTEANLNRIRKKGALRMTQYCFCLNHALRTACRPRHWARLALAGRWWRCCHGQTLLLLVHFVCSSIQWRQLHNSLLCRVPCTEGGVCRIDMHHTYRTDLPAAHTMSLCIDSVSRGGVVTCTLLCFHH